VERTDERAETVGTIRTETRNGETDRQTQRDRMHIWTLKRYPFGLASSQRLLSRTTD